MSAIPQEERQRWDEELVLKADSIVRGLQTKRENRTENFISQLARAVGVAERAGSPVVFEHWLRYQWARDISKELWISRTKLANQGQEKELAQVVLEVLAEIKRRVETDDTVAPDVRRERIMALFTRFLGFLRQSLKAAPYLQEDSAAGGRG